MSNDDETIFEVLEKKGARSFKSIPMREFNRMVSALTKEGSTPEDIVDELKDYRVDGHLNIDRAMVLPVYQDTKSNPTCLDHQHFESLHLDYLIVSYPHHLS